MLSDSPRPTSVHRRILALAFLGWAFDFYDLILYTFLTRPISGDLGLTRFDHSWALGISFTFTAVGGIASGFLSDRFGRRATISWTILLYSLGSLLSGLSTSKTMLFGARAITGMGVGGEWGAGHTLVAETYPPRYRGRAGSILQMGAPVGVGLATLIGTLVAPRVGWRAVLIGSSATALLAFFARRFMPESDLWLAGKVARFGSGFRRLLAGDLSSRFYRALVLNALTGASYWFTYSWLPEYLRSRGLTLAGTGTYISVIVCAEIVGYSLFGFVSDRVGRRPTFMAFAFTMAVGLLPLTVLWDQFVTVRSLIFCAMALVGIGTGIWSNFGPMLAELFPTETRNTAMGAVFNLARAAQLGAPLLIAYLEPRYGLAAGIGLAAAFAVLAGLFVWTLPETKAQMLAAAA